MKSFVIPVILAGMLVGSPAVAGIDPQLQPYLDALATQGRPPVEFVIDRLDEYDLLLFDDGWHTASEPFEFYETLIRSPEFRARARYVFVEVLPVNQQPHVDAYLRSDPEDRTLLYPAFQNDLGGTGWPLESYFRLFHAIHEVNRGLAPDERIRVVAVNAPTYWPGIRTPGDLALFRKSLAGNDYTMYRIILGELDGFESGRRGIFLTNTRHAYKRIKDREGRPFGNTGTFFHERHPGRTYSIRIHNLALSVEREKTADENTPETTAGMERMVFRWVRMADGLWDSAFDAAGGEPVAVPLEGNAFGGDPYIGNVMHKASPGQTMYDANDAVIFLAPLESLHNTAYVDYIYTPDFKKELARRYRILYTAQQLDDLMERNGVGTLEALIDVESAARPAAPIPQAAGLGPKDTWKHSTGK